MQHGRPDHQRRGSGWAAAPIAFAKVYEGTEITLFYSRIKWAESQGLMGPMVLAHTLVHEIAHNLQGIGRHSKTGVMKPEWNVPAPLTLRARGPGTDPTRPRPTQRAACRRQYPMRALR